MLIAYVSGHGFGHLTRLGEVLRVLRERAPSLPMTLVGMVPEALARRVLPAHIELRQKSVDVGLAQRDALAIDERETVVRCLEFDATFEERVEEEATYLAEKRAEAVLSDVPALPFEAASRLKIPCFGLANFSWDWIYSHLSKREPSLEKSAELARSAYAKATLLFELPFAGDLSVFPLREPVGLVARRPKVNRGEARIRLGLDKESRPVVLVCFGGIALPSVGRQDLLKEGPDLRFLLPEDLTEKRLSEMGLDYPDIVGASDVVLTKPGYGIVSDAIGAGVPIVYTDRGDFPEYPVMVREMPRWLSCEYLASRDLRAGLGVAAAVQRVLEKKKPERPPMDGAERVASRLLKHLARGSTSLT